MRRPAWVAGSVLVGAGLALQAALVMLCALGDPRERVTGLLAGWTAAFAAFGLAAWAVRRVSPGFALRVTLGFAVVFRVTMLGLPTTLSDDFYRYLWDGRLTVAGHDAYAAPPDAPGLLTLRDEVLYPRLNSAGFHTVYPPVSQAAFATAWWCGGGDVDRAVAALRVIFLAADLGAVASLLGLLGALGLDPRRLLLYAWQPLIVIELIGGMHSEALLTGPLALTLWAAVKGRPGWAGAALAVAVWVKLFPVVLLGALAPVAWRRRRGRWRGVAALMAGFATAFVLLGWPMLRPMAFQHVRTSVELYAGYFAFNNALFDALTWAWSAVFASDAHWNVSRKLPWLFAVWVLGVWLWGLRARQAGRSPATVALLLLGGYLVLSPTVHPWYLAWVLWLVPLLPGRARAWGWLSYAAGWSYLAYHRTPTTVPAWALTAEWLSFAALLGWDARGVWIGPLMRARARWKARRLAPHVVGGTLLDVGCGEGYVAEALALRTGAAATLVDIDDRRRVARPFVRYDGLTLPFADGAFSTVTVLTVLHHCDDPGRVLDEAVRVAGGRLIVAESVYRTSAGRWLLTAMDRFFNGLRAGAGSHGFAAPLRFATVPQWQQRFAERGLLLRETVWLSRGLHRHVVFVLDVPGGGLSPRG